MAGLSKQVREFVSEYTGSFLGAATGVFVGSRYMEAIVLFSGTYSTDWYAKHPSVVLIGIVVFCLQTYVLIAEERYKASCSVALLLVILYSMLTLPIDAPMLPSVPLFWIFIVHTIALSQIAGLILAFSIWLLLIARQSGASGKSPTS